MAPSSMFSYLRPGHAKRNASTLAVSEPASTSPAAYSQPSSLAVPLPSLSSSLAVSFPSPSPSFSHTPTTATAEQLSLSSSPRFSDHASHVSASPISPFPPQLPPITRVASQLDKTSSRDMTSAGSYIPPQQGREQAQHPETPSQPGTHLAPPQPTSTPSHLAPSTISPSYPAFSKSQTSLLSGLSEKLSGGSKAASTPTHAPAKAKSRLTLRNPMSLLMRRRSAQPLDPLADESLATIRSPPASSSLPDNYDPSIRGNIFHDFNAPRLNRNYSANNVHAAGDTDTWQDLGRVSPSKIDKEHTPVFREHFDDDTSYEQSRAAIRAETLVNKDFLARNSVQFVPPIAKELAPPMPTTPPRPPFQAFDCGSTILSPVQETPSPTGEPVEVTPHKRQSTKSPPSARSRAASVTDPSFQPAGLPAHFSSRSSRFSFQIPGGSDSAQEKLLEERHKVKAAQKASKDFRKSSHSLADEYDDYDDMERYDMDGGYDEEIPMVGEQDEFDGLGNQTLDSQINGFDFSLARPCADDSAASNALLRPQQTLDVYGNPIGFAVTETTMQQFKALNSTPSDGSTDPAIDEHDLSSRQGSWNVSSPTAAPATWPGVAAGTAEARSTSQLDLGDMYFDDGLIGDQEDPEPAAFDENIFDDPKGPLYERKVKFSEVDGSFASSSHPMMNSETGYEADDDTMSKHLEKSEPSLAHKTSMAQQRMLPDFSSMNAYHSALADAANRAEASGRFERKASVDTVHASSDVDAFSVRSNSRPSLIPDDGRPSLDTDVFPPEDDVFGMGSGYVDDYDYSDFDSAMEDDPIIAAANAEALAYDDEGFYGQEFGFYASGAGESSSAWGGFFGPSGLGRAPSGRNASREPNLTPITERSEYSTRNSFISLHHFRDGNQPLNSPGLAQLARMSPYGWPDSSEDMTFDALAKLRKGAFGSTVASLPGSNSASPRNSSPMGMQFVPRSSSAAGNRMKEQDEVRPEEDDFFGFDQVLEGDEEDDEGLMDAVNVTYEGDEGEDSDDLDRPESPTLTASEYHSLSSPARHSVGNEAPLLPPISEWYARQSLQLASHTSLPMSPGGRTLTAAANVTLPTSPYGSPLASPRLGEKKAGRPSIDTSVASLTATSNSAGPCRHSAGIISPVSNSSPLTPSGSSWKGGHSRKGSAADSVAYVREHDECGEGRWVLERRRTAESGELELIGRQIVEGGRI